MSEYALAVGRDHAGSVPSSMTVISRSSWATLAIDPRNQFIDHHVGDGLVVLIDGRVFGLDASHIAQRYRSNPDGWTSDISGEAVVMVLDDARQQITVQRDTLGVRPIVVARQDGQLIAAASAALLLEHRWVDGRPDELTLMEMLAGPLGHDDRSVHRGIKRLPAGATATISETGELNVTTAQLCVEAHQPSISDAAERCREIFDRAVQARLADNDTIAVEVSGGLDSSTVAGTVVRTLDRPAILGRIVYADARADEREYSDAVSTYLNSPIISADPTIPTIDQLDEWTLHLHHPVPPINGLMVLGLRHALRAEGADQTMSGLGGDDAFAAMPIGMRVISACQQRDRAEAARLTRWTANHRGSAWTKLIRPTVAEMIRPHRAPSGLRLVASDRHEQLDLERRQQSSCPTGIRAIDRRVLPLQNGAIAAQFEDLMLIDELSHTRGTHPFFDPSLVTYAHGLPPSWARTDGVDRSLQRRAFGARLPDVVAERTSKAEFSDTAWTFLEQPGLLDRVLEGPLIDQEFIDADNVRRLVRDAKQRRPGSVIPADAVVRIDAWLRVTRAH